MLDFYYSSDKLFFPLLLLLDLPTGLGFGTVYIVSESGVEYTIIQNALNVAVAGDTILVRETVTPYVEELQFPISGDSVNDYITLMAYEVEHPLIDGTGLIGRSVWSQALIKILNLSYIGIICFEIRNLITSNGSKFGNLTGAINTTKAGGTAAFTNYLQIIEIAKETFEYTE